MHFPLNFIWWSWPDSNRACPAVNERFNQLSYSPIIWGGGAGVPTHPTPPFLPYANANHRPLIFVIIIRPGPKAITHSVLCDVYFVKVIGAAYLFYGHCERLETQNLKLFQFIKVDVIVIRILIDPINRRIG